MRLSQIVCDLAPDALLRAGKLERQVGQQPVRELAGARQHRCATRAPRRVGTSQRQLLRQQFVEGDAPPGRMIARLDLFQRYVRRRLMQEAQAVAKVSRRGTPPKRRRQRIGEVGVRQRTLDQLAQYRLAEAGGGRVNRRQAIRQRLVAMDDTKARMHHLVAKEATAQLAKQAQPRAGSQRLLLARIEVEEAQHEITGVVAHAGNQLPTRAKRDLAGDDVNFELRRYAGKRIANRRQPRFVLIAQRQVQQQVGVAAQPEARQFFRHGGGNASDARRLSRQRGSRPPRPTRRAAVPARRRRRGPDTVRPRIPPSRHSP